MPRTYRLAPRSGTVWGIPGQPRTSPLGCALAACARMRSRRRGRAARRTHRGPYLGRTGRNVTPHAHAYRRRGPDAALRTRPRARRCQSRRRTSCRPARDRQPDPGDGRVMRPVMGPVALFPALNAAHFGGSPRTLGLRPPGQRRVRHRRLAEHACRQRRSRLPAHRGPDRAALPRLHPLRVQAPTAPVKRAYGTTACSQPVRMLQISAISLGAGG